MKVVRHDPTPPPLPPPTYDIQELSVSEVQALVMVCWHATAFQEYLKKHGFVKAGLSVDLNRLYHALKVAGVSHP